MHTAAAGPPAAATVTREQVIEAFQLIDANKDSMLSRAEVTEHLQHLLLIRTHT